MSILTGAAWKQCLRWSRVEDARGPLTLGTIEAREPRPGSLRPDWIPSPSRSGGPEDPW
jgi:hypothetical protein